MSPLIMASYILSAYLLNRTLKPSRRGFPGLELIMQTNLSIRTLYLVGPSSTGKSTLFHAIVGDMGLDPGQCITEVARTVMRNTNFSKNTVGCVGQAFRPLKTVSGVNQ